MEKHKAKPKQKKVVVDLQHPHTHKHVHHKPIEVEETKIEGEKMDLAEFQIITNEPIVPKIEERVELSPNLDEVANIENIDKSPEELDEDIGEGRKDLKRPF